MAGISPTEETIESKGLKIFVRSWRPDGKPRAVVVICHGVNSHGGQYLWTAEQLVAAGFAVYALDLRGRGKSERRALLRREHRRLRQRRRRRSSSSPSRAIPALPVFLLGHSAGGVISCVYTLDHQAELAGLHLRELRVPGAGAGLRARRHQGAEPHRAAAARAEAQERGLLARSRRCVAALERRSADRQRGAAGGDRRRAGPRRRAADGGVPDDHAAGAHHARHRRQGDGAAHGSQFFYDTAGSKDKTLKLYEGHFHDLLNDLGKEGVMADIDGWIDKHLPAA